MIFQDKIAVKKWDAYIKQLQAEASLPEENSVQQRKRISLLESDPEQWFQYYFPNYYKSASPRFHKTSTKKLLKKNKLFIVRAWARGLAKDVRTMMETLYLALAKKEIREILLISSDWDKAADLLEPYRINLEANPRLINDYGAQKGLRGWRTGDFITNNNVGFLAFGAGQSPRGTRLEDARPDHIIITDLDTDESARNVERTKERWKWVEKAVIPTVDIAGTYRIILNNNIIAKVCAATLAKKTADVYEVVNIRDKNGKSTWPEKNSEKDIDNILSKISWASAQGEYFNNPITEGTVFKEVRWGKIPQLRHMDILLAYGDPATSNKDKGKGQGGSSYKGNVLLGYKNNTYYIVSCFLDQTGNYNFCKWYWLLHQFVNDQNTLYHYIENNSLQDPFYEQVYQPLFLQISKEENLTIYPVPDKRSKPDKFTRIEGNLEPLNRAGKLIFNEAEKGNPHMMRLEQQFLAVEPKLSACADGPDAVEGGKWVIDHKLKQIGEIYSHYKRKRRTF